MSTLLSPTSLSPGWCRCAQSYLLAHLHIQNLPQGLLGACRVCWNMEAWTQSLGHHGRPQSQQMMLFAVSLPQGMSGYHWDCSTPAAHLSPPVSPEGTSLHHPKAQGARGETSIAFTSLGTDRVKIAATSVQTETRFGVTLLQTSQLLCGVISL